MKEKLNLRNFIAWGAALLVIVAFFVAFGAGLKGTIEGISVSMKGLVIGSQSCTVSMFGIEMPGEMPFTARAGGSLAGVIIALIAGLGVVATTFVLPEEKRKMVVIACGAVVVVCAVLLLLLKVFYIPAVASEMGTDKEMVKTYLSDLTLNGSAIASAIMMILGGGAMVASELVIKK